MAAELNDSSTAAPAGTLQSICYERGSLRLLDQTRLPLETVYLDIKDSTDGWNAIRDMVVRGAPAIAIAAALSLAVEIFNLAFSGKPEDAASFIFKKLEYLVSSRPTAVNLSDAAEKLRSLILKTAETADKADTIFQGGTLARRMMAAGMGLKLPLMKHAYTSQFEASVAKLEEDNAQVLRYVEQQLRMRLRQQRPEQQQRMRLRISLPPDIGDTSRYPYEYKGFAGDDLEAYIDAAETMLVDDVAANEAIGFHGASHLRSHLENLQKISVLTHCNTGSLATAGYGTALGGSRLTAFELVHEQIPATLIADSAAAALMKAGRVNAVVVGADRIAANGDTANKIGTYSLALSAYHHGIRFYVAAPITSIDLSISSGEQIVIEERSEKELLHSDGGRGKQVAASGISVWNPAFDVTPARLITAIITEKGVIKKSSEDAFDIQGFIENAK
ncbi:hypothetical protein ZIOFF_052295 [Zingiber officinale]|uniref:Methylthioribose-1-phosphate isomerase n=1 Tax=Zingiber officinale TaxID=94328 RepID=A0A8J5FNA2_ZINOF|nr:hypothetical protein ZIOFF_052295 [Zingiber officinale]